MEVCVDGLDTRQVDLRGMLAGAVMEACQTDRQPDIQPDSQADALTC
jgi:hypothetical protein